MGEMKNELEKCMAGEYYNCHDEMFHCLPLTGIMEDLLIVEPNLKFGSQSSQKTASARR